MTKTLAVRDFLDVLRFLTHQDSYKCVSRSRIATSYIIIL